MAPSTSTPTRSHADRPPRPLRIGEVAELTGTTPRTIRYYEEIGLLPDAGDRAQGAHRTYTDADVQRLCEAMRLKDLLGLSLEQLKTLVAAQDARDDLRRRWREEDLDVPARRRVLEESLTHIATQLAMVGERQDELGRLESELTAKRRRIRALLRELDS